MLSVCPDERVSTGHLDAEELDEMDTAELECLVARGRERRFRAVRDVPGPVGAEG